MKLFISIFIVIVLSGCKSTPSYLNIEQLKNQYQIIGLAGFNVERGLEQHTQYLSDNLQEPIKSAMIKEGFNIVDATQIHDTYKKLLDNTDNLYDPLTGQKNENLSSDLWKQALIQTQKDLGIDVFLFMGVDIVRAYFKHDIFSGKVAMWYGQEESYLSDSAGVGDSILSFIQGKQGYVPGSRVYVNIRSGQGELLTTGAGGIELVAQFNGDGEIEGKATDKIFQDKSKFQQAIEHTLLELKNHKGKK